MYLFHLFRSFLPLHNPIGFGAVDFVELALAILLAGLAFAWRSQLEQLARAFAQKTLWSMALLAVLPVALRLLLLPHYPIPTPNVSDDFSYVLLADTLRHFRLANPPHALPQFFAKHICAAGCDGVPVNSESEPTTTNAASSALSLAARFPADDNARNSRERDTVGRRRSQRTATDVRRLSAAETRSLATKDSVLSELIAKYGAGE